MALTKKVNGQTVIVTGEEEQAILDEWTTNALPPHEDRLEFEAQQLADQIMNDNELLKTIAFVMVDLAIMLRDDTLSANATTEQVRAQFRDLAVKYLRETRGLTT